MARSNYDKTPKNIGQAGNVMMDAIKDGYRGIGEWLNGDANGMVDNLVKSTPEGGRGIVEFLGNMALSIGKVVYGGVGFLGGASVQAASAIGGAFNEHVAPKVKTVLAGDDKGKTNTNQNVSHSGTRPVATKANDVNEIKAQSLPDVRESSSIQRG